MSLTRMQRVATISIRPIRQACSLLCLWANPGPYTTQMIFLASGIQLSRFPSRRVRCRFHTTSPSSRSYPRVTVPTPLMISSYHLNVQPHRPQRLQWRQSIAAMKGRPDKPHENTRALYIRCFLFAWPPCSVRAQIFTDDASNLTPNGATMVGV